VAAGFSLVEQTKVVTAASELGRNTIQYGGGGIARVESVLDGSRRGVRLEFIDHGPGIADIALALHGRLHDRQRPGLGLSGAKRLSDEFVIDSAPARARA
jgi:serine/threonine-protein kinase RsbT